MIISKIRRRQEQEANNLCRKAGILTVIKVVDQLPMNILK